MGPESVDNQLEKYLSLNRLAERQHWPLAELQIICRNKHLPLRHFGQEWYIPAAALEAFQDFTPSESVHFEHPLLKPVATLVLLASLVLVLQSFWQLNAWQEVVRGGQVAARALGSTLKSLSQPEPVGSVANVFSGVETSLTELWLAVANFWQALRSNLGFAWEASAEAWRGFLGRAPPDTSSPLPVNPATGLIDPNILAELKAQIKAEITSELLNRTPAPAGASLPSTGLVVLPSTGDPTKDEALALELKNSFSDQVEIKFEASGQTGVITPVFRAGRGDDYLFVITPIKPRSP